MSRLRQLSKAIVCWTIGLHAAHPFATGVSLAQDLSESAVGVAVTTASSASPPSRRTISSIDLIRRALASNGELAAARLDVDRARARQRQAGVLPNPSVDIERRTGRFTGSRGESETSIGFAFPLEIWGQRRSRLDLAEVEIAAAEAGIADRERQLVNEVRARYVEALAALRELEIANELSEIDNSTLKSVAHRVSEGDSAPLELRLLEVEAARTQSRRATLEGRAQAALIELRTLAGMAADEPVTIGEDLVAVRWAGMPATRAEAVETALRNRPDLRLARLEEAVAEAGLRLVRAQARPEVTLFTRFSVENAAFDDTPVGVITDRDKTIAFGVSIGLPVFNRNQGAKAEAAAAVAQARKRREFSELRIRAEVEAAYARYRAAESAISTFDQGVVARSLLNIQSIRGAYQVGAFRVTELLSEQRRFIDTLREFVESLAGRYRALADLQMVMGVEATVDIVTTPPVSQPVTQTAVPESALTGGEPGARLRLPVIGPEDPESNHVSTESIAPKFQ